MIRRTIHTIFEPRVGDLHDFAPDIAQVQDDTTVETRPAMPTILFVDALQPPQQEAHLYPLMPDTHYGLTLHLAKRLTDAQRLDLIKDLTGGIHLPGGPLL